MAPPTDQLHLDVEAISGICGSISIACWVVVFSPQIIENFRRGRADGLSIQFVIVWMIGDVFNILGAVFQGVIPTMLILAIYYTLADVVLLGQIFWYRGFTIHDAPAPPPAPKRRPNSPPTDERTALLPDHPLPPSDWTHLSPAVPLVGAEAPPPPPPTTRLQAAAFNFLAIVMVCLAGILGWWLSRTYSPPSPSIPDGGEKLVMSLWGQIFGYFCAFLYLGSRLPQLLLNYRRKSTEGVSMLFFLFACLGNATYVLSILAYEADCVGQEGCDASGQYWNYIAVNASWIIGSAGTLLLDGAIFAQFFLYEEVEAEEDEEESVQGEEWDQRPLLERTGSYLA